MPRFDPTVQRKTGTSIPCPGCEGTATKREHGVYICESCGTEMPDIGAIVAGPKPICDFCSHPDVRWRYGAVDFEAGVVKTEGAHIHTMSESDWAACQVCYTLIEQGNVDGLVQRSVSRLRRSMRLPKGMTRQLINEIRPVHERFMRAKHGEPEEVKP